jgi:hypothetical protein
MRPSKLTFEHTDAILKDRIVLPCNMKRYIAVLERVRIGGSSLFNKVLNFLSSSSVFRFLPIVSFHPHSRSKMTRPSLQFLWCFSVVLLSLLKTTVSTPIFEEGPLFKRANSHYRRTSPSASQTAGALPVHSLLPAIRPGQQLSSIDSLKLTKHIELYYEGARNGSKLFYSPPLVLVD